MPTVTELGQRVKAKHPGAYDDLPDDELGRRVKAKFPGSYDDFADSASAVPPMAMTAQYNPATLAGQEIQRRVSSFLPTAGGFAGGLIGKIGGYPGAVAGASVGGAAGEGAGQILSGQPLDPAMMGARGLEQGAYEAAGGAIGKGMAAGARPLMRRALGVGKRAMSEFPDVVETVLKRGFSLRGKGVEKATRQLTESDAALQGLLKEAASKGGRVNTMAITRHARTLLGSKVLEPERKAAIAKKLDSFIEQHGKRISPVLAKELKTYYQNLAKAAYPRVRGGLNELALSNEGLFAKRMALGAREELEKIPRVAAQEAETQSLIGAQRAVRDAVQRTPRGFDLGRPGSYPVLNSPFAVGQLARLLNARKFQEFMRQNPRGAAAIIMQLNQPQEPDATQVYPVGTTP